MNPAELIAWGAWPVVFALGYSLGVVSGVQVWHRKLTREVTVQVRVIKRWVDRWLMVIVSVFVIVVSLLIYHDQRQHSVDTARIAASSAEVKQLGECVAAYDNRLSAALKPVRQATRRNGAADIEFKKAAAALFIPGHDKRDVVAVKAALAHNLAVYASLNRERAKNPYPKPPKEVCPK